jgi:hypothetical protein
MHKTRAGDHQRPPGLNQFISVCRHNAGADAKGSSPAAPRKEQRGNKQFEHL